MEDSSMANENIVWVFGYGSLIWDHSDITVIEERDGQLKGWHRDWTFISKKRRHGAPTCNLQPGGSVKGKFLRLNPKTQEADLEILRKREGSTEKAMNLPDFQGEVHFWRMGRNLEKFHETKGLVGIKLYEFLAKIAHSVAQKGPDGLTAEEYAFKVHKLDPEDEITKIYMKEIEKLTTNFKP